MKDRVSEHPGRVTLTPVPGQENTFDMARADNPVQEGTPINKNTLLTDEVAAAIGTLDGEEPPKTPNEALEVLRKTVGKKVQHEVGDIWFSRRTDLGDNYALCNGDVLWGTNAALAKVSCAIPAAKHEAGTSPTFGPVIPRGKTNQVIFRSTVLDTETGEIKPVALPSSCLGIDWNGEYYVAACGYMSTTLTIYTSEDLLTWTTAKTLTLEYPIAYSYCAPGLMYNGNKYYLLCQYYAYQSAYLYEISSDLSSATTIGSANYCQIARGDDDVIVVSGYSGSDTPYMKKVILPDGTMIDHSIAYNWTVRDYNDSLYIAVLPTSRSYPSKVTLVDKSTFTASVSISVLDILGKTATSSNSGSVRLIYFDDEIGAWVFMLSYYNGSTTTYFRTTLPERLDSVSVSDFSPVESVGDIVKDYSVGPTGNEMFLNASYVFGKNCAVLPTVAVDGAYAYVKVRNDA